MFLMFCISEILWNGKYSNDIPEDGFLVLSKTIKALAGIIRLKLYLAKSEYWNKLCYVILVFRNTLGESGLKALCDAISPGLDVLQLDLEL